MTTLTDLTLIGIAGHAGAGKDTVMNHMAEVYLNVYREAFADELKSACAHAFGIPWANFTEPELKNEVHPFWGVTPRQIAQFVGTELFRNNIGGLLTTDKSFWIKRLEGKLTGDLRDFDDVEYTPGDVVVIPDVRFQNEYDWIVANGGYIVIVQRPGYDGNVGISAHASEAGFTSHNNERTYIVANTDTLEYLYKQVETIMDKILTRKDTFEL